MAAKTENECDSLWFYDWIGKKSGYYYRMVMIPSYDAYLSTFYNAYEMPTGLLKNLEYDWAYEKEKYIGTPKMPEMNFTIDLSILDGKVENPEFDLFAKLCYENTAIINFTKTMDNGHTFDIKFIAGNLWYLAVNYSGTINGTWNCLFAGMQESDDENIIDMVANEMQINCIDIGKSVAKQIKTKYFLHFWAQYNQSSTTPVVEFIYQYWDFLNESTNHKAVSNIVRSNRDSSENPKDKYYFGIAKFHEFNVFLDGLTTDIWRHIRRDESVDVTFFMYFADHFKQVYDSSGDRGSSLASTVPYFIAYVMKNTKIINSTNVSDADAGTIPILIEKYPTLWDYLVDMLTSTMQNYWTTFNLGNNWVIFDIGMSNRQMFSISKDDLYQKDMQELKIFDNYGVAKKVEISIQDAAGNDLEKINFPPPGVFSGFGTSEPEGSKSDGVLQIVLLHNNTPVVADTAKHFGETTVDLSFKVTFNQHDFTLLYKDTPLKADTNPLFPNHPTQYFRVHEKCQFDLGNNTTSDDLAIYLIDMYKTTNSRKNAPFAYGGIRKILAIDLWNCQLLSCQAFILAQTLYFIFNQVGQNKIQAKTEMTNGYFPGTGNNIWFQGNAAQFNMTITTARPYLTMLSELNTKYKATKVKVKIIDGGKNANHETVTFEAMSTYA